MATQASACGCQESAIGLLVSVTSYVLGTAVLPLLRAVPVTASWPVGLGVGLAGGAIGKALGLWAAHHRFERLRHEVDALANARHTIGPRAIAIDSTGDD